MINFNRKKHPGFWENYLAKFKEPQKSNIENTRFVIFDTETTGLEVSADRILSIGAISVIGNKIDVSNSLEIYLDQDMFNAETVKIHGILKGGNLKKITEKQAVTKFIDYIGNAVLVAHHVDFDIAIINNTLKRLGLPKLKNTKLDTGKLYKKTLINNMANNKHYGLDELCDIFKIAKNDRHTASGDAYIAGILFLKIVSILKKKNDKLSLKDLCFDKKKTGLL